MPRIAIVSSVFPDYPKGYISTYAGQLSHALTQQGHDIHIITSAIPDIVPTFKKVNVHKIVKSWSLMDLRNLTPLFQQIRPDIIHILHPTDLAKSPTSFFVQGLIETNKLLWKRPCLTTLFNYGELSWFEKIKLAPILVQSDEITVSQSAIKEEILRFWKHVGSKTHVINIGAREEAIWESSPDQRTKWDVKNEDIVICFLEELSEDSGFQPFIEAVTPLLRKKENLKILVPTGWKQPTFRYKMIKKIERQNILNRFIFTGQLNKKALWSAKQASDLFVFLSQKPMSSNFSPRIIESLHSQCPILTWDKNLKYDEFGVQNGQNIWISPFGNIEVLRNDLELLMASPRLRKTLTTNCAAFRQTFSFDAISNEFSRCYSRLLGQFNS